MGQPAPAGERGEWVDAVEHNYDGVNGEKLEVVVGVMMEENVDGRLSTETATLVHERRMAEKRSLHNGPYSSADDGVVEENTAYESQDDGGKE